ATPMPAASPGPPPDSAAATRPQGRPPADPAKTQTPRSGPGPGGLVDSTPLPPLVTAGPGGAFVPRLVTPTTTGANNPAVTLQRPSVVQTGRMGSLGVAPPEKTGDGALFPALVVAVGATGRAVAERLKRVIGDRYGNPALVPNVRFLYV